MKLRINEAYEHEPILPYQGEESCPLNCCNKVGTQCVDISEALQLTPAVTVGTATVTCQGTPGITCVTNAEGTACTVTMTQQVCVSVPVRYGVNMTSGEPTIACAEGSMSCGCG